MPFDGRLVEHMTDIDILEASRARIAVRENWVQRFGSLAHRRRSTTKATTMQDDTTMTLGAVVFGPRWDKPTAVGAGDGETFIARPVYLHEMRKLIEKVAELEARIATMESNHAKF
jgi:hypothetical protein